MLGMIAGSSLGGFVPLVWGGSLFSLSSVFFTVIGGLIGIFLAYKLTRDL